MYLAKINYKKENVVQVLSSIIKDVINENTVIVCIGTDRAIGDALGPLVGTSSTDISLYSLWIVHVKHLISVLSFFILV